MKIEIKKPCSAELEELNVKSWPVWEKQESVFDWYYDQKETCYFLEGEVEVTGENGEKAVIKAGEMAVFPQGLNCTWKIRKKVKKHYKFG